MAKLSHRASACLILSGLAFLPGCFDEVTSASAEPIPNAGKPTGVEEGFPLFASKQLKSGRVVWMDNCRNCHERGVAGAPMVSDFEAWEPRIAKEKLTLYQHALEGFFGEDDAMMPARGGNEELTDEQVKSAVDYMVATAIYFKEN